MGCLVSVIIPAFNCEKYIERCINGVLKASNVDFEVIVINDGSTDSTEAIVSQISQKNSRVKLYSWVNQGVSSARNKGIELSSGKYIIFSDSDDVLEGNNLESLLNYAQSTQADVIAFGRINHYPDGTKLSLLPNGDTSVVQNNYENAYRNTILNQQNYGWSSCNKLFKRDIIINNNLRFVDYKTVNSEDRLFNFGYFMNVSKVAFYDKCFFHNYVRSDSLSHQAYFPNVVNRNIKAYEYVCDYTNLLPDKVRFKLLKHYFISFVNNVVVLELSVNKVGFRKAGQSFNCVMEGMLSVLKNKGLSEPFKREKGIYYSDSGFKYKLLNQLLLNHKLFMLAKLILFGYTKATDLISVVKTKGKEK